MVIPDEATQKFIMNLAGGKSLWLGATDEKSEGRWIWVDGTEMKFKAFDQKEPSNSNQAEGRENFLETGSAGGWNDIPNESKNIEGYICEWPDNTSAPRNASGAEGSDSPDMTGMPKLIDKAIDRLSVAEKKQLGQRISRNDIRVFDEMTIRAFKGGVVIAQKKGEPRTILLKEENPKQAPFGFIGGYYKQEDRAETFGSPIEGEFALFDERYRLHVFDKAIIVWRRSDKRLESAIFEGAFH